MKAQVCLVLLAILGFAFSQNFLDNNSQAVEAVKTAASELESEVKAAINQAYAEKASGESVHTILSNLTGFKGQVVSTLMNLRNSLKQDADLMAQVNNFTNEITQQVMPFVSQGQALLAGLKNIQANLMNQTAQAMQINNLAGQFKTQLTEAISKNNTDLTNSLIQLYGQLSTDLFPLASNIVHGNETKAALDNFVDVLKIDLSAYANNTNLTAYLTQLKSEITQVFANNTEFFSQLQNYTGSMSLQLMQLSNQLTSTNNIDAAQIVNALALIDASYSTAFGLVAAGNYTDLFVTLKHASVQVYGGVYTAVKQIVSVLEKDIVIVVNDVKIDLQNAPFMAQLNVLAAQLQQQLVQTFGQDLVLLNGLHGALAHIAPNGQLVAAANQIKNQVLATVHANTAILIHNLTQLAGQIASEMLPLAGPVIEGNHTKAAIEAALQAAADLVNKEVAAFVANNTAAFHTMGEQIGMSIATAVNNNSALFSGLQNYSSQISASLSQLAAQLTQENNTDAAAIATSLKPAVDGFSTAFENIAANNGTIAGQLEVAYENAVNTTGMQVGTEVKEQITTIDDEIKGDISGNNTNNGNNTQTAGGNTADSTPLGAEKAMISFVMVFGALAAFFL